MPSAPRQYGTRTIVFIDEIHRFNKAQQDAFLPHVEKGNIRLIGATTENPSFEIISALLSRSRVYVLQSADGRADCSAAEAGAGGRGTRVGRAEADGGADEVLAKIAAYSSGDARSAYNVLEIAATLAVEAAAGKDSRRGDHRRQWWRTRCRGACCAMTRRAKNTTT